MRFKMGILAMVFVFLQIHQASADTKNMVVLDVRTLEEFEESHVKDSVNIDVLSPEFKLKVEKLDKNKSYKLYCRSGNRSGQAEKLMKSMGFKDVENIGSLSQAAKKLNRNCEGKGCLKDGLN